MKAFFLPSVNFGFLYRAALAAGLGLFALSGCATVGDNAQDPWEDFNRTVFDFNNEIDNLILEPVAESYVEHVPEAVRTAVLDTLRHLKSPVVLANSLLQGNWERAGNTLSRVVTNTIAGFGGLVDTAGKLGVSFEDEDFGQTLAVWGFGEGPYLMLPVLGPMTVRDGMGRIFDAFVSPSPISEIDDAKFDWSRRTLDAVDTRAGLLGPLNDLERTSLDYYAAIKSLYRQKRIDEINNGAGGNIPVPVPNISFNIDDKPEIAGRIYESNPVVEFHKDNKGEDIYRMQTGLRSVQ